jgi:hypothetical protein
VIPQINPIAPFAQSHDRHDLPIVGKIGPKFCTALGTQVEKSMQVFSSRSTNNLEFLETFARHFPISSVSLSTMKMLR